MCSRGNLAVALGVACVLGLLPTPAHAQEPAARARAALALAKARTDPAPPAAPMPRQLTPVSYPVAKATSLATGAPAVVYVGCDKKHEKVPGAVTTCVPEMSGYEAYTILVCYPRDGGLYVSDTLKCPASPEKLKAAVEAARVKADPAPSPEKKAGKSLDWS